MVPLLQLLHVLVRLPAPLGLRDPGASSLEAATVLAPPPPHEPGLKPALNNTALAINNNDGACTFEQVTDHRSSSMCAGTACCMQAATRAAAGRSTAAPTEASQGKLASLMTCYCLQAYAALNLVHKLDVPLDARGRLSLHAVTYELVRSLSEVGTCSHKPYRCCHTRAPPL